MEVVGAEVSVLSRVAFVMGGADGDWRDCRSSSFSALRMYASRGMAGSGCGERGGELSLSDVGSFCGCPVKGGIGDSAVGSLVGCKAVGAAIVVGAGGSLMPSVALRKRS